MANTNPAPEANFNAIVADNIRAELARERWTGRKAAMALGVQPMYISRRLSGETPMDPNDLVMFARLLRVPVSVFFATNKKGPATEVTGPDSLPDLDSNQEPAGSSLAPSLGRAGDMERHRRARYPAPMDTEYNATITQIKRTVGL